MKERIEKLEKDLIALKEELREEQHRKIQLYKEGDWVWTIDHWLVRISSFSFNVIIGDYFNEAGIYKQNATVCSRIDISHKATPEEVSEALIREAKKRGLNPDKPTTLKHPNGDVVDYLFCGKLTDECFKYYKENDSLWYYGVRVYEDGKWSEIVKEEDPLTVGRYDVKINALTVHIGCEIVTKETIKELVGLIKNQSISIQLKETDITKDLIKLDEKL